MLFWKATIRAQEDGVTIVKFGKGKRRKRVGAGLANSYVAASFSCKRQTLPTNRDTLVLRALSGLRTLLNITLQAAITNLLELVL